MIAPDPCFMPATALAEAIRSREVSPREVIDALLREIERVNPLVNAYCTLVADQAIDAARAAERAVIDGTARGPLHGVPFSVKDTQATRGVRTTRGSLLFRASVPDDDAIVVARLKAAGAILIGKTNTPEFGSRGDTTNRLFGTTRNPWRLDRTAGGSSGGATAAAATGLAPLHVGTDGAGSIRIPASFCGVVGLKASAGRVPSYPVGGGWPLGHVGPIARTVRDVALMLDVIAGPDGRDLSSLALRSDEYLAACDRGARGLRIAWSPDLGYAVVDPEVRACAAAAAARFEEAGCVVEEIDPGWPDIAESLLVLFFAGIGAGVAGLLDAHRAELDPTVVRMAEQGLRATAVDHARAHAQRFAFWDTARGVFERYDLLLTPTVACRPFPAGDERPAEIAGRPLVHEAAWTPFGYPFNATGQPAISVPCGFTSDGLPVGLQIVGRPYDEVTVLRAAAAFEALAPWAGRRPPLE